MSEKRRILLRTVPFLIIGLLLFVAYLVLFVDISEMVGVIQRANMLVYSLAALTVVLSTFLFALSWQYLLLPLDVKISLKKNFAFVWISIFADLIVPAESVSGEITRAYLMSKEPDVNTGKVVASLVSQRILGTVTTTATLFICFLGLVTVNYSMSFLMLEVLVLMSIASAIAFGFLVTVCVKEKWTERLVIALMRFVERISKGRFKFESFQNKIIEALRAFYESLRTYGSKPIRLLPAILFNILSWLSSIVIVFLVFVSIGYLEPDISTLFLKVAIVHTFIVAVKSIPIGVPMEVGLPDIIMTTLFAFFGIPADPIGAAATVLTRILTVWLRFSIGFVALQWVGVKSLMESGVFGKAKNTV